MKRSNAIGLVVLSSVLILMSCKKDLPVSSIAVDASQNKAPTPPFPFNWQTADFMPTPPGTSILVPWASGSNKNYNTDIAFDFKSSDGWSLVYNTFNTTSLSSPAFFALYNKYRGLLRFYLYLFPSSPTPSTYINHGINLNGSATPYILNYIGQDVVDINTKLRSTTGIQKYQIQSTGGWYVMQYEIPYDPSIASTPYQNLDFQWYSKSINITQVSLSGSVNGTLKGSITQPGSTPTIGGTIQQIVKGSFEVTGPSFLGLALGETGLPDATSQKLQQSVLDVINGGIVKNFLSALVGGSSGTTQQVNLTLNAQIGLAGTLTNSTGLANPSLVIPGLVGSQTAIGLTPGYNSPMGVFYLSAKPKIKIVDVETGEFINIPQGFGAQYSRHKHTYTIDNSSFATIFNPAVINSTSTGAHIENLTQQLLMITPALYLGALGPLFGTVTSDGTVEQIGNYTDVRSNLTYSTRFQTKYGNSLPFHQTHGGMGIRFIFDVVSNNGAVRVKIVKTFWADEVYI